MLNMHTHQQMKMLFILNICFSFVLNIIIACAKRRDLNWLPVFYQSLAEINISESV